jgi:hypothetical protein
MMKAIPLPDSLTDPLALSLLLLAWLRNELPPYVQFQGPEIAQEQKALFLMLLSGPPAIRFPGGSFFVETWNEENPLESEVFSDCLSDLMNVISQTVCRVEKGDSFIQFHLINHFRIEDESIVFTASKEVTTDLELFPDRRDALRIAAKEVLDQKHS